MVDVRTSTVASWRTNTARMDWLVVCLLVFFAVASTFVVRSAVLGSGVLFAGIPERHMVNYGIAFVVFFVASYFRYTLWMIWARWLYVLGLLSLVAVYVWGSEKNGARGWFAIPGVGVDFQPAELMKLFLILLIAQWLGARGSARMRLWHDLVPLGVMVFVPFVFVVMQPDLGNAVIFGIICIGMLFVARLRWTHIVGAVVTVAVLFVGVLYSLHTFHSQVDGFLSARGFGHWMERIDTFLYPERASLHASYQVTNSLRAIGSGALVGEGYLQGDSVHGGFIPYTYSDSIFVVIGEEFGFLGASLLLLAYFFLLYRLIWIAIDCPDRGGSYVIVGITTMLAFQIIQNIGMFLGLLPLTGITLPLFSYGGSSLVITMASIGLAMSVHIHGHRYASELQRARDKLAIAALLAQQEQEQRVAASAQN
jgi:rod shape determining protein RodA